MSGACLLPLIAAWLVFAGGHPTHTSATELSQEPGGAVSVAVRLFADDIGPAVGAPPGQQPAGASLRGYLTGRFVLLDRSGAPVALAWDGGSLHGDVLTVRSRARVSGGLKGATVTNRLLTERFADQVNLVRATYGGRSATLIFTRGDGPKALP
ncbi:MAG: hypothetical protein H0T50_02045 [Gemmatimonadales bacterium]|nr:hypothetical protein [Gemmatimonadales bacterium]